jgi:thioredoxin 1
MIEVKRFHAEWCGPCRTLAPIIENVKTKFEGVSFVDVDVDKDFELAQKYFVRNVPTVVIEKDGEVIERFVGVQSELTYSNAINEIKNN